MGREKREKERLKNKKNGIVIKQEKKRKMDEKKPTEREDNTRRQKTRERRNEKKRAREKKNRKPFPRPGHCFEIPPLPK